MKFKTSLLVLALFMCIQTTLSQSPEIEALVKEGIVLHDKGQFDEAIEVYKKALALNPKSSLVHYELALSYISKKDYETGEKHAKEVIDLNDGHMLPGYVAYGNALDLQGNPKKAIKVYEKALKDYDHYMLYYNYAYTCLNNNLIDKAYDAVIKGINNNPSHASSHLVLSQIMEQKGQRIKAMLPLYFFLLIEPNSDRAKIEYNRLRDFMSKGVSKTSEKDISISLPLNDNDDFGAAELMISLTNASNNMEENKEKSDLQLFAENNETIFSVLGELKKKKTGFWWDFYVTFFYDLVNDQLCPVYSYYASLSRGQEAMDWLDANPEDFEKFQNWLNPKE